MPLSDREPERLAEVYGGYASSRRKRRAWAPGNPGNAAIREELVAALLDAAAVPLARGAPVLDVGCGSGWWLRRLADSGVAPGCLHGVELQPGRVVAARKRLPAQATVAMADARALPYPVGAFGLVTLLVVLSSLPHAAARRSALAEACRVLAPGGVLAIWDLRWPSPNRNVRAALRHETLAALAVAGLRAETRTLTLAPPLARSLGRATSRLYPALGAVGPLRSHRLILGRRDG